MRYKETQKNVFSIWSPEEWRAPDKVDFVTGEMFQGHPVARRMIWYGPNGPEGDVATELEIEYGFYRVKEYQDVEGLVEEPEGEIRVTETDVDYFTLTYMLIRGEEAMYRHASVPTLLRAIQSDPERFAPYAVDLGVALIQYWGGSRSWTDALPT